MAIPLKKQLHLPKASQPVVFSSVAEGADALLLAELVRSSSVPILHIVSDDRHMKAISKQMEFFARDVEVVTLPAWDCSPYDRVSPASHIVSKRMKSLCRLAQGSHKNLLVITTVNATTQRVLPAALLKEHALYLKKGEDYPRDDVVHYLVQNGYERTATANDPGEYALRGSIIDIFPPGQKDAIRIDYFGDTVETIRVFDPLTQVSIDEKKDAFELFPASEVFLNEQTIQRFREQYRALFGISAQGDPLYNAISDGRKYAGMEHWLPLFYNELETIINYFDEVIISHDHLANQAILEHGNAIADHYQARKTAMESSLKDVEFYQAIPPELLYLDSDDWQEALTDHASMTLTPFHEETGEREVIALPFRPLPNFQADAKSKNMHPIEYFKDYLLNLSKENGKTTQLVIACFSQGSLERMEKILKEHQLATKPIQDWQDLSSVPSGVAALTVMGLERGFHDGATVICSEQDLLGERIMRPKRRKSASENFLAETASLQQGELMVHKQHGLGRFEALETIEAGGKKHDCLRLIYDGGDKLYIPVENMDMLSRYGSDEATKLDKLGSAGWQSRTAKLKKRIRVIADGLLKVAAERQIKRAPIFQPMPGLYDEFCARFPYAETEDQQYAIDDVMNDLASGTPMDRLICGDVGFGKTEVALRAAFTVAASKESSAQVVVVAPTTLLARQHYANFKKRFADMPVEIRQLSRMVKPKEAKETKKMAEEGKVDILIGTHAVLAKSVKFKNLALVIVDEEQLFGVTQKERLKELCTDVHVLTLSATPIPRTLQMSLSGIRDLSLIATPPIDRLAVRTFVMPYDGVVIRDAILREFYRGGRIFYVAPRISDLDELRTKLAELVPEVKMVTAHGQMSPDQLDDIMNAFFDGTYDLLLATNIVGSGLDIPAANTIMIHRADMFGLAQLYQLRGRVGRGKLRAYAYLTLPTRHQPSKLALKKLEVMHSLDTLGAGFTVASHDMDIRGFGNLLGDEQSGHIREVGIELYQEMLKEAINTAKAEQEGIASQEAEIGFSPQINLGLSVYIPDDYIQDLELRLGMYKRASMLKTTEEVEQFAVELIDRFGSLPEAVENLLSTVTIKQLCIKAGVDKLDAGAKGIVFSFHNNHFKNPEALIDYVSKNPLKTKIRADQKLVLMGDYKSLSQRIESAKKALEMFASFYSHST